MKHLSVDFFSWNALYHTQWNVQPESWEFCVTPAEQGLASAFALTHFAERKRYATVHLSTVNLTQVFGKTEEDDTWSWQRAAGRGSINSREPDATAACWETGAWALESSRQLKTSGPRENGWPLTRNLCWARNMLFLLHSWCRCSEMKPLWCNHKKWQRPVKWSVLILVLIHGNIISHWVQSGEKEIESPLSDFIPPCYSWQNC